MQPTCHTVECELNYSYEGFLTLCGCPDIRVGFRVADNPGVDSATSGLSQVNYGAENGAGKRWA